MKPLFTRHAKRRMRQRGVSSARASQLARHGRAQGKGTYKSETTKNGITYVVIYKVVNGKKVILSTWRK